MFKITFHSVIDLITNSSTEIFTNYKNSISTCKEMIGEIFKIFEIDKTVDEVFYINVFLNIGDYENKKYTLEEIYQIIQDVLEGKLKKPDWMIEREQEVFTYIEPIDTYFYIKAKEEKYEMLAKKIEKFLYSPIDTPFENR